jgi:hypothetical protein
LPDSFGGQGDICEAGVPMSAAPFGFPVTHQPELFYGAASSTIERVRNTIATNA